MENIPREDEERWVVGPNGRLHVKGDPGQEVLFDPRPYLNPSYGQTTDEWQAEALAAIASVQKAPPEEPPEHS